MEQHNAQPGFRSVKPKRKQKQTPSRERREARRGIERAARLRHEAWSEVGVPVEVTVSRLTDELHDLFADKRRAAGGA